ncbi:MAG: pitrilysin family protein [Ignavibacteriaceae bacterium]
MNNYNITNLSNGITVVSEKISHLKSFALGFWFNTGARDETPGNNGISHFIEHMVFKGTKHRSAKKISDEIESYGGYLNAFTTKEHTCFYTKGLQDNLKRSFIVISDMIQNPLFKDSHIKKEAGVVVDELRDINDNPEELIFDKFEETLFAGTSLSYPIIGTEKNIRSFNSFKLKKYHTENFFPSGLLITASGAVDHDKLVRLTEDFISVRSRKKNKRKYLDKISQPAEHIIERDIQQFHAILGKTTYGIKHEERVKLKILSTILGEGSSSRLFQAVREKLGITYQINTFLNSYYDISAFGIYFSTNEKFASRVFKIISREMRKLSSVAAGQRELKRVKEFIKGGIILSMENTTNRMFRLASSMLYFNRIIPVEEYLSMIDRTTADDLLSLSGELLNEDELTRIILKSPNTTINKNAA